MRGPYSSRAANFFFGGRLCGGLGLCLRGRLGLRLRGRLGLGLRGGLRVRLRRRALPLSGRAIAAAVLAPSLLVLALVVLPGFLLLYRAEDHRHVAAVEVGALLDRAEVGHVLREAHEQLLTALGVRGLATAEHD